MAKISPPLSSIRPTSAGEYAELDVLRRLADGLSDDFHLFHSVHWSVSGAQGDAHGQLDVVVVNRAGDVAVLEIKAGALELGEEGIVKRYGSGTKNVLRQARWQFEGILGRLKREGLDVRLLHLLVFPDQRVGPQGTVAHDRDRIADADDCQDLPGYLLRRLGSGLPDARRERVLAFFANRLQLTDDVAALSGRLESLVARVSGGLAEWVPRIHSPGGVVRVVGTAGSGKTQLALRLLRDAVAAGLRASYVCFNRPLADHMRTIAPASAEVSTFHQLAWIAAGRPAGEPDHAHLARAYAATLCGATPDLDLLVVDELQDFQLSWIQCLLQRLRPQGRLYLLDDPDQCLYADRVELELPDAVTVSSSENYRSPRQVVAVINALGLASRPIEALSPYEGEAPAFIICRPEPGDDHMLHATRGAVQAALDKGHAPQDLCLITWRGVERSRLLARTQLGDWRLRKFSGRYDERGEPVWADGDLRIDTLRRTKGQSAPAVVLTEVDFEQFGELERRLLFVGMTRARMHLAVVLSARAEAALVERLVPA